MKISKEGAITMVREQAAKAAAGDVDEIWVANVEELSRLCAEGVSKTHIAFLGTAIIAKAMHPDADLFAIKPDHAPDNPNAFSARTLCHGVLVPLAAELGISIGVTGREPLNNQPYFRMTRLDDGTPVHAGGRAAFDYMLSLVHQLQKLKNQEIALAALRSFIAVRSRYQPRYDEHGGESMISPDQLVAAIKELVRTNSEGGRCAQAVAAGLLDVFAGADRVESGRINDPSRRYPGDVCVRSTSDPATFEKAFEVRDKPVAASDVQIFGKKCIDMSVREAALVMVSPNQARLEDGALSTWAESFGLGLTLFYGWDVFTEQTLFWSEQPKPLAAQNAVGRIHQRLIAVEATPQAVTLWQTLSTQLPNQREIP